MPRGEFSVSADLPLDARAMFIERDSAAFRALLSKTLKIGQIEFRDMWEEGSSTFVRMVTKPEFGAWVPKSVAGSVQGSSLEFHDIIEYNPENMKASPFRMFVRTESPFLGDKLDIHLTLSIEDLGPGRCRQTLAGHIRVNIFGVGRVVEGIVKDSLQNTYRKLPAIVERWAAFRTQALAEGNGKVLVAGRPPVGQAVSWIQKEVAADDSAGTRADAEVTAAGGKENEKPEAEAAAGEENEKLEAVAAATAAQGAAPPAAAAAAGASPPASLAPPPEPEICESPDLVQRKATLRPPRPAADMSLAESQYFDASKESTEPSPESKAARSPMVRVITEPDPPGASPSARLLAQPRPPPAYHHRRNSSVDSGLPPEAGVAEHKASSRLWGMFNRYWPDWTAYWVDQGVELEADAAAAAEAEARGGSVVGDFVSGVGREIYFGSSALILVGYLGAIRLGALDAHPDQARQARLGISRRSRGTPPVPSAAPAVSASGPGRQVSLDRAEAELAKMLVKGGKPFHATTNASDGSTSTSTSISAATGGKASSGAGTSAAVSSRRRKVPRSCFGCCLPFFSSTPTEHHE